MFEGISFFDVLSDEEKDNLSLFCQQRFLKSGEMLFLEGDEAIAFYVLKSGNLKAYLTRSDGEKVLGYIQNSEIVGEMAIFTKDNISSKRTASVKAVEDSTLIVIMKYAIIELSQKHENIYNKIESIIAERIRKNQS